MYIVTFTFYKKYQNEKKFTSYDAARKFFNVIHKKRGVTSTKMWAID
jgi:hypothetical protein